MISALPSQGPTALRSCRAIASVSTSVAHNALVLTHPTSQKQQRCRAYLSKRSFHRVPQLVHDESFKHHGIGNCMSPTGFNVAWTQYQGSLVKRLNELTGGHPTENKETRDILIASARDPNQASLFNHASMAWNNHHFFSTLSPEPRPMSDNLKTKLSTSFSSTESFQKQFFATAMGMFGPGFVWLIRRENARIQTPAIDPELSILCTYIAGSPLPGAHARAQAEDMNTMNALTGLPSVGHAGAYSGSIDSQMTPGRVPSAKICLGVCTWEHAWIYDHGVSADGKRQYLEEWWKCIDWTAVEDYADMRSSASRGLLGRLPR